MIDYEVVAPHRQFSVDSEPFHTFESDNGAVWTEFYRTPKGYLLRFPDLADFEVSRSGEKVVGIPVAGTDENTLEHLYLNQAMPLACSRQGRPTFHASVVTVRGGCIAFLGGTGMGKSTLAASFALNGAAFLTDDALLLEESDDVVLASPSHASVRLWDDSANALVRDGRKQTASYISYSEKARLLAGGDLKFVNDSLPLLAAYHLIFNETDNIEINALAGSERHMAWIENSFLLDIEDPALLTQHFDWTHRIADRVPTFSLDYPRDYGMLDRVRQEISKHVEKIYD